MVEAALASDPAAQSCASQACDKNLATNSFMTILLLIMLLRKINEKFSG
jgi:hypothetical protein